MPDISHQQTKTGLGVDAQGGPVIDPTANVLSLVEAAVTRLNDLHAETTHRLDDMLQASVMRLDERINALVSRIDAEADKSTALRVQREFYETRIEGLLERQTDKSAILLAQTVDKVTERLAVVEKNQYQTGGQASVRDPAISNEIAKMTATLEVLSKAGNQTTGRSEGISQVWAVVLGVCVIVGTIIAAAAFVVSKAP